MIHAPCHLPLGGHRRAPDVGHTGSCESVRPSSMLARSSMWKVGVSGRQRLTRAPAIAQHAAMSARAIRHARDDRQRHSSSNSPMKVTKSVTRRKRTHGLLREATLRLVLCTKSGTRWRPAACHAWVRSTAHCRERGAPRRRRQGAVGHARKLVGS